MPASSQSTTVARPRQAPRDVIVDSWPLAEGDRAAWGVLAAAGIVFALAAYASASGATGAVIAGALLLASWRLWMPVRYEISTAGIARTTLGITRRVPWSAIGRVERRRHGLLVLREAESSPVATLRGLYLPFQQQQPDVQQAVDFYLAGRS